MVDTARTDETVLDGDRQDSSREGFLHFAARESATWVGWVCVGSGVATAVTFAVFFPFAVIPGAVTVVSAAGYWFARIIERRTETLLESAAEGAAAETDSVSEKPRFQPVAVRVEPSDAYRDPKSSYILRREGIIGFSILFCVGMLALGLSLMYFEIQMVLIAAFILFCYMLLIMAPVWLGWIEDDIEDTKDRLESTEQSESNNSMKTTPISQEHPVMP